MKHPLRVMVSRHSAFYSPLIATIAGGFLEAEGFEATYDLLGPGQRSHELIASGAVDIMQSAVSSNWKTAAGPLPLHFAQINRRDGFFLTAREPDPVFDWKKLEGRDVLADHAPQPLAMLTYAVHYNGADWKGIRRIDAGSVDEIDAAFRSGVGDYVHQQGPAAHQLEKDGAGYIVASVGASMPPVAFSSLCASREFLRTRTAHAFLRAYRRARAWVKHAAAEEIASKQAAFFPTTPREVLAAAIRHYQALGCWDGGIDIPRDLYEQALGVFEYAGELGERRPYEEVVVSIGPELPGSPDRKSSPTAP